MRYWDNLMVWLGFMSRKHADRREIDRQYDKMVSKILRDHRRESFDNTVLGVLGSDHDEEKE